MNTEFDLEMATLEKQIHSAANRVTPDALVRFAKAMLLDLGEAWRRAGSEQKQRVPNFLFQSGLRYSQELKKFEHFAHVSSIQWKK